MDNQRRRHYSESPVTSNGNDNFSTLHSTEPIASASTSVHCIRRPSTWQAPSHLSARLPSIHSLSSFNPVPRSDYECPSDTQLQPVSSCQSETQAQGQNPPSPPPHAQHGQSSSFPSLVAQDLANSHQASLLVTSQAATPSSITAASSIGISAASTSPRQPESSIQPQPQPQPQLQLQLQLQPSQPAESTQPSRLQPLNMAATATTIAPSTLSSITSLTSCVSPKTRPESISPITGTETLANSVPDSPPLKRTTVLASQVVAATQLLPKNLDVQTTPKDTTPQPIPQATSQASPQPFNPTLFYSLPQFNPQSLPAGCPPNFMFAPVSGTYPQCLSQGLPQTFPHPFSINLGTTLQGQNQQLSYLIGQQNPRPLNLTESSLVTPEALALTIHSTANTSQSTVDSSAQQPLLQKAQQLSPLHNPQQQQQISASPLKRSRLADDLTQGSTKRPKMSPALPNPLPPADPLMRGRMASALLALKPEFANHPMWNSVSTPAAATSNSMDSTDSQVQTTPQSTKPLVPSLLSYQLPGDSVILQQQPSPEEIEQTNNDLKPSLQVSADLDSLSEIQIEAMKTLWPHLFSSQTQLPHQQSQLQQQNATSSLPAANTAVLDSTAQKLLLSYQDIDDVQSLPQLDQIQSLQWQQQQRRALALALTAADPAPSSPSLLRQTSQNNSQLPASQASVNLAQTRISSQQNSNQSLQRQLHQMRQLQRLRQMAQAQQQRQQLLSQQQVSLSHQSQAQLQPPKQHTGSVSEPTFVKHVIIDILDSILETMPFDQISKRQSLSPQKVRAIFEAIVQVPMLRYPGDKRKVSKFALNKIREYHEAKKKMLEAGYGGGATTNIGKGGDVEGHLPFALAKFMGESGPKDYPAGVPKL
ncbi:hypothetical protein CFIMG_007214RA00001 [Ceratocystis fimbriata CBS 114723]|uniref:Uncharacterized protein n=1 Tax=Ceratocystis fimbriata CBS 114723 TaxID=1035309 RepID=A0A2C5XHA8_9PEZI|nr:hypothetical protein CFIMG_007214RA00001 [Ceratocystis fimbriata CBS 114723]